MVFSASFGGKSIIPELVVKVWVVVIFFLVHVSAVQWPSQSFRLCESIVN
jgi:hypothetical protein